MGWLSMTSINGFSEPRAYLDDQCTGENDHTRFRVLKSSLVRMKEYYAAIEQVDKATADRRVFATICMVKWSPRARDGYIFSYKDMSEADGPYCYNCPPAILDLLTPFPNEYAEAWRARCRKTIAKRKRPDPKPGDTIIFDGEITFTNGAAFQRMRVTKNPAGGRSIRLQGDGSEMLYRVSDLKSRRYM